VRVTSLIFEGGRIVNRIDSKFYHSKPWGSASDFVRVNHWYIGELYLLLGPKSRETPALPLALLFESHTEAGVEIFAMIRNVSRGEIRRLPKCTKDLIEGSAGVEAITAIWKGSLTNLNRVHLMDLQKVIGSAHTPASFGDRWPEMPRMVLFVREIKNMDVTMNPRYDAFFEGRRHWMSL